MESQFIQNHYSLVLTKVLVLNDHEMSPGFVKFLSHIKDGAS